MAWVEAKIKLGTTDLVGMVNNERVSCPCPEESMEGIETVSIDGKGHKIGAYMIDARDNMVTIILADAGVKQKEKSDDKPTKGRDTA